MSTSRELRNIGEIDRCGPLRGRAVLHSVDGYHARLSP